LGNRAFVIFPKAKAKVYLHWNGGIESVSAFLAYANEIGLGDEDFGFARFVQIVGNYFGGSLSLGVSGWSPQQKAFAEDNGAFYVERKDGKLQIVRWVNDRGEDAGPDRLPAALERAAKHPYNVEGKMLADIAEKNDPHFRPPPAPVESAA
jgi:hypothetical protein